MENIPSSILDLLQTKTFEQLSEVQRTEVEQYMSRQEYADLHEAALASASFMQQEQEVVLNASHKEELMKRLQQKHRHSSPLQLILTKRIELWKIASVMLIIGCGAALFMMQVKKRAGSVQYISQLDTVYLEKEMPVKVYDTVYLTRDVPVKSYPARSYHAGESNKPSELQPELLPDYSYSDINLLPIMDRDKLLNNKKGSTIKDDSSLINTYGFTRL